MQRAQPLSELRRRLLELYESSREDLAPFLSDYPLIRGTLYTLRRRCAKPSCRCARGERHESLVLTASVGGKTRLWTIPEERIDAVREGTQAYRKFRQSRAALIKRLAQREAELLRVIDAIEKARVRQP